ncbi:MAG: SHOCT domain-containing protein [Anaerolineae bacterium]|nr:SHOCT domain-containing protein [Anaerolineae bacterium]
MMMLSLALLWIGWIALGVMGVRALFPIRGQQADEIRAERPLDTLARRYASGEIDRDAFELMRGDLEEL